MENKNKKMSESESSIIAEILDKVIDKIHNEEFSIQKNNQRQKLGRQIFHQKEKIHSSVRPCVYPACTQNSIKRSHSIQKNNVLRNISDGNHVYKPEVDMTHEEPKMKMKKIGINKASTFPGFCGVHERLFEKFEKKGTIELKKEALLQTFRAICREKVFRENEREIVKQQRNAYEKELRKLAKQYVIDELARKDLTVEMNKINFSSINDEFLHILDLKIDFLSKSIDEIDKYMIASLSDNDDGFISYELNIDYCFPVCIAGFGNQKYKYFEEERNFLLFLNVIPYNNETILICYSLKEHEEIFESIIKYYSQNILTILNFIEGFMVNSSDHWFIRPIFWDSLPKIKKEYIFQCLFHTKESFLEGIPYSIFDDTRNLFIDTFINSRNGVALTHVEENFLKSEKLKLTKDITLKPQYEIFKGMTENFNL